MFFRISFILLLSLIPNACVNVSYNVNKIELSRDIESNETLLVCDDETVIFLSDYNPPKVPDVKNLPKGDRMAEIMLLLDYIDELKLDINKYIRDYKCRYVN